MEAFMESVHKVFEHGVELLVLLIELIGIAVLCYTVVKAIISIIRGEEDARLELAEGIALALDFKMCGEVLRTVIVRDLNELLILGIVHCGDRGGRTHTGDRNSRGRRGDLERTLGILTAHQRGEEIPRKGISCCGGVLDGHIQNIAERARPRIRIGRAVLTQRQHDLHFRVTGEQFCQDLLGIGLAGKPIAFGFVDNDRIQQRKVERQDLFVKGKNPFRGAMPKEYRSLSSRITTRIFPPPMRHLLSTFLFPGSVMF